jgi:hypothetical protein
MLDDHLELESVDLYTYDPLAREKITKKLDNLDVERKAFYAELLQSAATNVSKLKGQNLPPDYDVQELYTRLLMDGQTITKLHKQNIEGVLEPARTAPVKLSQKCAGSLLDDPRSFLKEPPNRKRNCYSV